MDLTIIPVNASKIKVLTEDEGIREDLYQSLRFVEANHQPSKFSKWDGEVRMYDKKKGFMNYGLLAHLLSMAKERGWSVDLNESFKSDITNITIEQVQEWCDGLDIRDNGVRIYPYDYQVEGLYLAIKYSRMTLLAATAAGKSLLQYLIIRFSSEIDPNHKILLTVPSVNLVSQMLNDFRNYSSHNGWDANKFCHQIYEGATPYSSKPVIISTWQSVFKLPADYFEQYTMLIGDEVHLYSAKSLSYIGDSCINAYARVGLTGTLKQEVMHPLQVQQQFGPIKRIVTTKELQDSGRAAKTLVTMMHLLYPTEDRKKLQGELGGEYKNEIEFLIGHPKRNEIIRNLAKSLKGNSLFLFDRIDSHLEIIHKQLLEMNIPNKTFLVIHGDVKNKDRDAIKAAIERGDDIVLLFGKLEIRVNEDCDVLLTTGVSIKAKYLTTDHDVSEKWILEHKKE